jgi:Tfp pilus assembly protein FimT
LQFILDATLEKIMDIKLGQKGYSFTELMTVIAIIMILTVLAIPSYNRLTAHQRLTSAARTLLADIRSTRELSIKEGWQYGIYYNSTTQYRVVKSPQPTFMAGGTALSAGTVVVTRDFSSRMMGYSGITLAVPANMPVFQRSGKVLTWTSGTNYTSAAPNSVTLSNSYSEGSKVCLNTMGYSRITAPANSC